MKGPWLESTFVTSGKFIDPEMTQKDSPVLSPFIWLLLSSASIWLVYLSSRSKQDLELDQTVSHWVNVRTEQLFVYMWIWTTDAVASPLHQVLYKAIVHVQLNAKKKDQKQK